jgi:outer membrane lipoprotein-sorting protein
MAGRAVRGGRAAAWAVGVVALAAAGWFADRLVRDGQAPSPPRPGSAERTAWKVPLPSGTAAPSAEEILALASRRCAEIQDYRCIVRSTNLLNGAMEENVVEVHFKRPGLFRHALLEGANKGTVLAKGADGRVFVRPGGVLGLFVVEMDLGDKRLLDGRGIPFHEADWATEASRLAESAAAGGRLSRCEDQIEGETACWVLELTTADGEQRSRAWIDQRSHLLKRIATMHGGRLVRDASYTDAVVNANPPDSLFRLK